LTAADYSTGEFLHYSYDAAGNRLTQETHEGTNTYSYDAKHRITQVDGVAYNWDPAGNLLSDGERTFAYDHADCLTSVSDSSSTYAFSYDGLGNRYQQSIDSVTTTYSLDIAADLTQVFGDGTNSYLYGLGRIGEAGAGGWLYPLSDALGSTRQLTNSSGDSTLSQSFESFAALLKTYGDGSSDFGFTGEQDEIAGLVFLRARYYDPGTGRFITKDTFPGTLALPKSMHPYMYALNNPIMYIDPNGEFAFIPLLLVAAAGGLLGGLSYYALKSIFHDDPCWQWNWTEALLWGGVGTGLGIIIGMATYGVWVIGVNLGVWGTSTVTLGGPIIKVVEIGKEEMARLARGVDLSGAVELVKREYIRASVTYGQVKQYIVNYYLAGEHVATIHKIETLEDIIVHTDFKSIVIEGIKYWVR